MRVGCMHCSGTIKPPEEEKTDPASNITIYTPFPPKSACVHMVFKHKEEQLKIGDRLELLEHAFLFLSFFFYWCVMLDVTDRLENKLVNSRKQHGGR